MNAMGINQLFRNYMNIPWVKVCFRKYQKRYERMTERIERKGIKCQNGDISPLPVRPPQIYFIGNLFSSSYVQLLLILWDLPPWYFSLSEFQDSSKSWFNTFLFLLLNVLFFLFRVFICLLFIIIHLYHFPRKNDDKWRKKKLERDKYR